MSLFKRLKNIISAEIDSRVSGKKGSIYKKEGDNIDKDIVSGHPTSQEQEYYANLELEDGASFTDIKIAYKNLLKKYHPDKFHNDDRSEYAGEITKKINEAYEYFKSKHKG